MGIFMFHFIFIRCPLSYGYWSVAEQDYTAQWLYSTISFNEEQIHSQNKKKVMDRKKKVLLKVILQWNNNEGDLVWLS